MFVSFQPIPMPTIETKKVSDVLPIQRYLRDIENMELLYYHFNREGNPKTSQAAVYRALAEEKVKELKLRL